MAASVSVASRGVPRESEGPQRSFAAGAAETNDRATAETDRRAAGTMDEQVIAEMEGNERVMRG